MANKRIKDLATTATSPAVDDFIALDGADNNTRKIDANKFLVDAPSNGSLYARKDGAWKLAASPDDLPSPLPSFFYNNTLNRTTFLLGNIPNSYASYNSALTQLYLGNSVKTIGNSAFIVCSGLTGNLVIPNSVTTIGIGAFTQCSGLTGSLTIGNSVTSIGSSAFSNCTGFTSAYLNQPIGNISTGAFGGAFTNTGITNVYIGPNATGYTLGAGQTIGGKSGITVSLWTNYPNVP